MLDVEDREAVVDVASQAAARGKEHISSHQPSGEVKLLLCGHARELMAGLEQLTSHTHSTAVLFSFMQGLYVYL